VRLALLAALFLVGVRLGDHGQAVLSRVAGFGLACAVLLVVSPVARNHYFVLLTPAALFVPVWLNYQGRRRAAVALAVVPAVLIVLQYVLLSHVGRIGLLGLGTTGWVMAAMVLMTGAKQSAAEAQGAYEGSPTEAGTSLGKAA